MTSSLTQELIEARDTLTRQLEILRSPASYGKGKASFSPDNKALISKLEEQPAEISAMLAERSDPG